MKENESKRGKDDMDFRGRRKANMAVFGGVQKLSLYSKF
jgi:hypothetical protein